VTLSSVIIKANAVTRVELSADETSNLVHRQRRQTLSLTPAQKTELVSHHNALRRMEGADNMELMVARPLIYLANDQRSRVCTVGLPYWPPSLLVICMIVIACIVSEREKL